MCGSGGDGGYQKRQDAMKKEQDLAIQGVNHVFGKGAGAPIYKTEKIPGTAGAWNDSNERYEAGRPATTKKVITGYDTTARDKNAAAREQLYKTIMGDAEARLLGDLGDDKTKAERQVRFQLARQGLGGGSTDIDQNRDILQNFQEGSLEARQAGLGAANQARGADEKTRVGLINNIRQGMSEADALSAGYAGMQSNADSARDAAMTTDIGNFFDDIAILQNQYRWQQDYQNKKNQWGSGAPGSSATRGGTSGMLTG